MIRLDTIDWRWVVRLAMMVLAVAILPVLSGIALDRLLQTSPIITLMMMLLGFNLGIYMIARNVAQMYARTVSVRRPQSHRSAESSAVTRADQARSRPSRIGGEQ